MRVGKVLIGLVVAALLCYFGGAGLAQAEVENYSFGLGAGVVPDYEGSDDYEVVPVPFAEAVWSNNMYVRLQGLKLMANVLPHDIFRLGPMANYRGDRDDVDDSAVDRLEKVDNAFELGAFAGVELDQWYARLEYLQDISDEHDGYLFTLAGGYNWQVEQNSTLSFGVSTTYADSDYMETYFGIDRDNALRSGLREFGADSGIKDVAFSLGLTHRFTENWGLRVLGLYKRLTDDAADSPITDDRGDRDQFLAGALVTYTIGKPRVIESQVEPYTF
jgi:outer membrane scaffolding protein for murein synthesis (MipA/OmpV family)